jgi:hypothetical protein
LVGAETVTRYMGASSADMVLDKFTG